MLPSLKAQVQEMTVDGFGRAIVRFADSGQLFRWNGFDWIHLWCALEGRVELPVLGSGHIYAILNGQHSNSAKLANPKNLLMRLDASDHW